MESRSDQIQAIAARATEVLTSTNAAREAVLGRCREAIRHSANAIRAVHRGDFETADELAGRAGARLREVRQALEGHADIFYAGFVHDAEKEYAEAQITLAIIAGRPKLPGPDDLNVEVPAYLNGMGEAVGELRRHLLDALREGRIDYCERCLAVMDEIYGVLVNMDFPDAMTGGLRRTTDSVRGILERTRGDFTIAARQRDLESTLADFEARLRNES
jgi:translin